jgi:hypothetical protein
VAFEDIKTIAQEMILEENIYRGTTERTMYVEVGL